MRRQTGRLEWTDETVTICHGRNNVKQNLFRPTPIMVGNDIEE